MRRMRPLAAAAALAMSLILADRVGAEEPSMPMGPMMMAPMMGIIGPHDMMGQGGIGMAGGPQMCAAMTGHIDGRLAFLKAELKITAAQEPLWHDYAAALRDEAEHMRHHCSAMMSGRETMSLPERLDRHEQMMASHLDAMRVLAKALKPLYASLDETQKRTADQLSWGPMGMI